MTVDFDRLVDRLAIAHEEQAILEERTSTVLAEAESLLRPRLTLVDEQRRIVRVWNAPQPARVYPPPTLSHYWTDTLQDVGVRPVGRYHASPTSNDLDYHVPATRAGDALLALLQDGLEPSVVVRRWSNGAADLLVSWE